MHETTVDRYVRSNEEVWRVVCEWCGVLADGLGSTEAPFVGNYLATMKCSSVEA